MTRFPFRPSYPFILMGMVVLVAVWKVGEATLGLFGF